MESGMGKPERMGTDYRKDDWETRLYHIRRTAIAATRS